MQTMSPTENAHEYALDMPLAKVLVGEPTHLSAYDVSCTADRALVTYLIISQFKLWQLHKEKRILRKSYLDHWEATKESTGTGRPVDAIISPAVAYTACPHGCNS
jgi:amidase